MITTADFDNIAELVDRAEDTHTVPLDTVVRFSGLFATRLPDLDTAVDALVAMWAERRPRAVGEP